MTIKNNMKIAIKKLVAEILPTRFIYGYRMYKHAITMHAHEINGYKTGRYFLHNINKFQVIPQNVKYKQVIDLISSVDICPVDNNIFFYSIDCFKSLDMKYYIFDNYCIDYNQIVNCSLKVLKEKYNHNGNPFALGEIEIINALEDYVNRMKKDPLILERWGKNICAIESLFDRPATSFFEALQRILFFNQFIWQTKHKDMGLGHLDWILQDIYENDIQKGILTRKEAKEYLRQFFFALHEYYWFKSSALMGDTGQIIIIGGIEANGSYRCSALSYLFIEISKELMLPDPKLFLRCSFKMPAKLLSYAIECIATGIGTPFLSNDDVVIPAIVKAGYDELDAYNYGASACWEPLIPGITCDQNNRQIFNFAQPLINFLETEKCDQIKTIDDFIALYKDELSCYIKEILTPLTDLQFEDDPLLSLTSEAAILRGKDITRGGAKYSNIGVTSVGLASTINSIINVKQFVFDNNEITLNILNGYRKENFVNNENWLKRLKSTVLCFGCNDSYVISLTNNIMEYTESEFKKYHSKYGGNFKFGLSSPAYITAAINTPATFDGRRNGDPFSTHISSDRALPVTELLTFASKLDYSGLKCNGNVVDFFVSPDLLKNNLDKYALLVKSAFAQGVFQMQMNVVSSKTLIAAREHPERFPDLIVRVWGFSAYFKDLPDEYKDVLIQRAIESEKAT